MTTKAVTTTLERPNDIDNDAKIDNKYPNNWNFLLGKLSVSETNNKTIVAKF